MGDKSPFAKSPWESRFLEANFGSVKTLNPKRRRLIYEVKNGSKLVKKARMATKKCSTT